MKIIEQQVTPKSNKAKPEDGIVSTDNFVAVIDGSTSKTSRRHSRWYSNGRYAMKLISDYIRHADKNISVDRFCYEVTEVIRKHYKKSEMEHLAAHPEERLCASCIVFSRLRREIWMIGDCQCLVGDEYYDNPKPGEAQIAELRAAEAQRLLQSGECTVDDFRRDDISRKAILPRLVASMVKENVDYAVIDGFPIPMRKVKVLTLDFSPWTVVLASDGYPFLCPTLDESEARLQRQIASDPLNIDTFKATKACLEGNNSFDDRSYIRIEV